MSEPREGGLAARRVTPAEPVNNTVERFPRTSAEAEQRRRLDLMRRSPRTRCCAVVTPTVRTRRQRFEDWLDRLDRAWPAWFAAATVAGILLGCAALWFARR